jgi:hypothetical protein
VSIIKGDKFMGFKFDTIANSNVLDQIIDWKIRSPRHLRNHTKLSAITRGEHMQRQFTVELRVDYADNDKNETMRTALQHAARHVYATAVLLSDGVKPQVAVFSDDFFSGHEEIKLLEDTIQHGIDATNMQDATDQVSGELMSAMKDIG